MDVNHVAKLANITLRDDEVVKYSKQFDQTLEVISSLSDLKTDGVTETAQVTGLTNVTRDDEIDQDRVLSQDLVLSQAKQTHNGYFVVPQLIENAE